MAQTKLTVKTFGRSGVNADKDPFDLANDELARAQNTIADPATGSSAVRKRAGLVGFNTSTLTGDVLGGSSLPGPNLSQGGTVTVYIGRGPVA